MFRRSQKRHIAPGVCVIVTDRLRVVFICDPRCSCPVACPVPCQVTCGRSRAVGGRGLQFPCWLLPPALCADARQEHVSRQLNCVGRRRERRVRRAGEATRHVTQVGAAWRSIGYLVFLNNYITSCTGPGKLNMRGARSESSDDATDRESQALHTSTLYNCNRQDRHGAVPPGRHGGRRAARRLSSTELRGYWLALVAHQTNKYSQRSWIQRRQLQIAVVHARTLTDSTRRQSNTQVAFLVFSAVCSYSGSTGSLCASSGCVIWYSRSSAAVGGRCFVLITRSPTRAALNICSQSVSNPPPRPRMGGTTRAPDASACARCAVA